jgi:hypothetical protein
LAATDPVVLWSHKLQALPRGLSLAREKGWLLVWDERGWLYLFSAAGKPQGQRQQPKGVIGACCADDGSALAAIGAGCEVSWLAPDLSLQWETKVPGTPLAVAIDSFGQYVAVADDRCGLHIYDCLGRTVRQIETPRALHHLVFVPTAAHIVVSSDFGLVACLDFAGRWIWRDGLVIHVGSLAVSGIGDQLILACYTEGLQRYALTGSKLVPFSTVEPWRLVSTSFDGRYILTGGLSNNLSLLDGTGKLIRTVSLDSQPIALALAPLGDQAFIALEDGQVLALELVAGS